MRRRRNLWLWIFGLPLFLGMLAHWGFHFFVLDRLDRLAQGDSGVRFQYQEVRTSLLGEVEIEGARLALPGLAVPLELGRVELRGPAVPAYLLRNNPLAGFGPPRFLSVHVAEARLPLAGRAPGAGDGCDLDRGLSPRLFRVPGFDLLESEAKGRYGYRPEASTLEAGAELRVREGGELKLEVRLQNVTDEGFRGGQLGTALLSTFRVKVTVEPGFGRRLVRRCAARLQLTPAAFESRLAAAALESLERWGVVPGPGLERVLQRYAKEWGSLELDLQPPVPMSLAFLPFVPAEQLHEKLGLELLVNGEAVEGLRFGRVEGVPEKKSVRRTAREAAPRPQGDQRTRRQWVYRSVDPGRLSLYLGHRVRLQERGDPVRQGVLVEVRDDRAVVEQRVKGGKFMAHLSLEDLVKAEVLLPGEAAAEEARTVPGR